MRKVVKDWSCLFPASSVKDSCSRHSEMPDEWLRVLCGVISCPGAGGVLGINVLTKKSHQFHGGVLCHDFHKFYGGIVVLQVCSTRKGWQRCWCRSRKCILEGVGANQDRRENPCFVPSAANRHARRH
jgi:hypothetical protein